MQVNVETYNVKNGAQFREANDLFDQICKDGVKDVKILLEIGCGSGNVTKLVSETIPHEKMYACDIDPAMVEHAIKLNDNNPKQIDFFIQDISAPWEALHRTLRDLEGKVDLLWSNRVLHWIPDDLRLRAAQNIVRLLRTGGRVYINTTLTLDPLHALSSEARAEFKQLMQVPSIKTQHEWWRQYFSTAGLSSLKVDFFERTWDQGSNQNYRYILDFFHFWKRYIPENIPAEQHDEILKKLGEPLLLVGGHPLGQPALNPADKLTVSHYGQFRIIGAK